ncbi:MAG TPA: DNA-directed RNA polymerase subunit alpha C-terminal domain-containing protein [Thermomicrobiales bacterium]|jgi:hypothetical protein|nr:DNA-directed RNA polymerase subunit alpha C-terminal domain-containing protein [Thermomicrobiales bacterium]
MSVSPRPSSRSAARGYPVAAYSTGVGDPFATNPIRRSLAVVLATSAILGSGFVLGETATMLVMISVGWVAIAMLVLTFPILIWSLVEEGIRRLRRRFSPHISQLGLSPRIEHILTRHGLDTIRQVHETSDEGLLLLSNMDVRGLNEVRRAISLWHYRRWQEAGFPARGMP